MATKEQGYIGRIQREDGANERKEKICCVMDFSTREEGFSFDFAASIHYAFFKVWYWGEPMLLDDPIEVEPCDGGNGTVYPIHRGLVQLNILITNENSEDGEDEEC